MHLSNGNGNGRRHVQPHPQGETTQPARRRQNYFGYGASACGVALAAVATACVNMVAGFPPFILFMVAISVSLLWIGRGPALVAFVLSVLGSDFLFVHPTFTISADARVAKLALAYCAGAIISYLVARRRLPEHLNLLA